MASVSVDFTWRDGALAPNLLFGSIPESIEAGCYLMRFEVCGLNVEIYNERMRAEKIDEHGWPLVRAGEGA